MIDRGKVIKGLECHADRTNLSCNIAKCPYYELDFCGVRLSQDALALLKEQEEKLKFLDALYNYINPNDMEQYMQMYRSLPVPSDGRSVKWNA
jgi:hypothetical protein